MKYFFLALSAALIFSACSTTPTPTPNKENILRTGKWRLSGGTLTFKLPSGKDTTVQYLDYVPDCYKDDYIVFDSLNFGKRYINGTSCTVADPEYTTFVWRFTNNYKNIDLYNGFNNLFAVADTIQPYRFDTIQINPYLILDTIHGINDTAEGYTRSVPVLDTIRELRFKGTPIGEANSGVVSGAYDINGADVTDFSDNAITILFSVKGMYPDSTNYHAGTPALPPVLKADTLHYKLKYTK